VEAALEDSVAAVAAVAEQAEVGNLDIIGQLRVQSRKHIFMFQQNIYKNMLMKLQLG
jgi:hypothetical protein